MAASMRFKPWMLAPQAKTKAGPWGALPPAVLAALNNSEQSPMVRAYLLNGSWPGAKASSQVLPEPVPEPTAESTPPQEATTSPPADNSSLSLMIRVVQPTEQESEPSDATRHESGLRRLFRTIRRKAA